MIHPPPQSPRQVAPAIRHAIRHSGDSIRTLAARLGLNPKTVAKWRARTDMADRKRGPATPAARILTPAEEATILALRRYMPLSLDDSMAMLGRRVPALTRSTLHRLLKRHGLSRPPRYMDHALPDAARLPGCFHIDVVPVITGDRMHYLFLAVEQNSALIFGLLKPDATQAAARDFLEKLADSAPASVRLVLTSDRFQFTTPGNSRSGATDVRDAMEKGTLVRAHPFEYACTVRGIEHHLVPDHYPWDSAHADWIATATATIATMGTPDAAVAEKALHREMSRHNDCPLPSLGGLSPGSWLAAAGVRAEANAKIDRTMKLRDRDRPETPPGRSDGPPYRPGRRDSTREAILEASHSLLARDGPEGLSLSEVARLAGVNRGTAYQHFKTRDGLIAATGRWMSEKLHRAVFAGSTPGAATVGKKDMASLAGRLAGFAMDNPLLCRAWLLQLLSAPDPAQDLFWRDYMSATGNGYGGQDSSGRGGAIDSEVASVAMLAGAFLWPTWARTRSAASGLSDAPATTARFANEWLRIVRPSR